MQNFHDYTTRREGWASDIYYFDNVAISTGYAPFGNVKPSYELTEKYEKKAGQIRMERHADYKEEKAKLDALIKEFIKEAIQESEKA